MVCAAPNSRQRGNAASFDFGQFCLSRSGVLHDRFRYHVLRNCVCVGNARRGGPSRSIGPPGQNADQKQNNHKRFQDTHGSEVGEKGLTVNHAHAELNRSGGKPPLAPMFLVHNKKGGLMSPPF